MGKINTIFLRALLHYQTLNEHAKNTKYTTCKPCATNNDEQKGMKGAKKNIKKSNFNSLPFSYSTAAELLFSTKTSRSSFFAPNTITRTITSGTGWHCILFSSFFLFLIATNIKWKNCTHSWRWAALHVENKSADVHLMRLNQMAYSMPAHQLSVRT